MANMQIRSQNTVGGEGECILFYYVYIHKFPFKLHQKDFFYLNLYSDKPVFIQLIPAISFFLFWIGINNS